MQLRAIKTLHLALEACGRLWIPEIKDWRLNERHYGGLTGLDKAETAALHGDEQVKIWRRSFECRRRRWKLAAPMICPPIRAMPGCRSRYRKPQTDHRAGAALLGKRNPAELAKGETVIIAAHGNACARWSSTFRIFRTMKSPSLEIPTGQPIIYEFDAAMVPGARYYLKDR